MMSASTLLWVPETSAHSELSIGTDLEKIKAWIDALPLIDAEQTLQQILPVLKELNRLEIDITLRHQTMDLLVSVCENISSIIRKKYLQADFPLSEKYYSKSSDIKTLYNEMSLGYKFVVRAAIDDHYQLTDEQKARVFCNTIHYLANLILENYLLYELPTPRVWAELNSLYAIAAESDIHRIPVQNNNNQQRTVEQAYLQILLVAAINPYRLMRGEAEKVFLEMAEWSQQCTISSPRPGWTPHKDIIIDLSADAAPRHTFPDEQFTELTPLRIISTDELRKTIFEQKDDTSLKDESSTMLALRKRQQRDMLSRLVNGWKSFSDRISARSVSDEPFDIVKGLVSCHHLLSSNKTDEEDTSQIESPGLNELSLAPNEDIEWGSLGKASQFAIDRTDEDIWDEKTVIARSLQDNTKDLPPEIDKHTISKINDSEGGSAFQFDIPSQLKIRVGDLVCLKPTTSDEQWKIAAVRWLNIDYAVKSANTGIMYLADDITPIFAKALEGAGKGGDFSRGLLIQAPENSDEPPEIILPSSIFDIDSLLLVTGVGPKFRVRLTSILDSSESYGHFSCTIVATPKPL